jgi:hypothetical protein
MKRRNFLYSVSCGLSGAGLSSIFHLDANAKYVPAVNPVGKIQRFGDGRDWFFEKRLKQYPLIIYTII